MFIRTERSVKEFLHLYPFVSTFIIINLIIWILISVFQTSIGFYIYNFGVGNNLLVHIGEYWRLVTPIFLHAGFGHMLFNSFALVLFGPALERMTGSMTFVVAYMATGIAGNIGTYIIEPQSFYTHVGASGAIYGLFGIYLYMTFFRKDLIDPMNAQIIRTIFIIGLVLTFIRPNINIAAHIFGFIGGFALGPIILKRAVPFFIRR
ncbi:MAG TPA: rhomboid family intramembrane serine protease [Pseudogracilibacillus sp.]|nr:rhomboid family intramembrane serine protease [Pseudogracilibacillus sp.]